MRGKRASTNSEAISVVIPALNEEAHIGACLDRLAGSDIAEVIVVDGGSADATVRIARSKGARVCSGPANRGRQQNIGAQHANGAILVFLHADTSLPGGFADQVRRTLTRKNVSAGAFRFRLDEREPRLRLVEWMVALRCRLFSLPYGDQAIFVSRELFDRAGRFANLPVMEDFDLLLRLKRLGRISLADGVAVTSARRWRREGVWRLTLKHQMCILGYYLRIGPERLARWRNARESADLKP